MQSAESSVFDRHLQCYRILLFLPAPPRVPAGSPSVRPVVTSVGRGEPGAHGAGRGNAFTDHLRCTFASNTGAVRSRREQVRDSQGLGDTGTGTAETKGTHEWRWQSREGKQSSLSSGAAVSWGWMFPQQL